MTISFQNIEAKMKKILFITLSNIKDIDEHNIYSDLMREFAKKDNEVYIVSPVERRYKEKTHIIDYNDSNDWHKNVHILKIKTGNIQKTNIIEKGISTVLLEGQIKRGIKKYFNSIKFDIVTYSTPPITLVKPILFVKKRDNAKTYLMLKDIFPQNAVDLGMMSKTGLKGLLYKYFRNKEKKLYAISDKIGCMSQANVDYVLNNNPEISKDKVEVFPNCIEVQDFSLSQEGKIEMRKKYNLPLDKKIFVYGGNLGKPQGISYILDCLKAVKDRNDCFFLIVGNGTEFGKLEEYYKTANQNNFVLMRSLSKDEYDKMIASCDIGMIFLDNRFTIPNFPSRLLSYMQAKLPVICCTDKTTDIGQVVVDNGFGFWCESRNPQDFITLINKVITLDLTTMQKKEFAYLINNYSVERNINKLLK